MRKIFLFTIISKINKKLDNKRSEKIVIVIFTEQIFVIQLTLEITI